MCGILGTIPSSNTKMFEKALKTINHRGPDSSAVFHNGNVSLGHVRLKIVDLSNRATQPMHFPLNTNDVGGGGTYRIKMQRIFT
ncbi:hypothetical protein [Helicobacter trogontum]|uniref:hypothetical protein n=1 Tax=Helicobacter trogontum TaxID=50960 RepID=UPI000CF16077|nr:hypothetical protein [Helicobacter trogontum]